MTANDAATAASTTGFLPVSTTLKMLPIAVTDACTTPQSLEVDTSVASCARTPSSTNTGALAATVDSSASADAASRCIGTEPLAAMRTSGTAAPALITATSSSPRNDGGEKEHRFGRALGIDGVAA